MGSFRPGAEGPALGPIQHRTGEIRIRDLGITEAALHEHGVAQLGSPQIGLLQAAREHHRILEVHIPQIGTLKVAAVEHGTSQVSTMEIDTRQVGLEKFLLLQIAAMHVGLDLLLGPLPSQFRCRDGQGRAREGQQKEEEHGQGPAPERSAAFLWHGHSPTLLAQVMAAMALSLRVVVPPHPLIAHWLTILRDASTPAPLFATAMGELGRWLTYEALRDWLPHCPVTVQTPTGSSEGQIVDPSIPLLAVPVLRGGLGLWQGAQGVVPSARVCHVGLDAPPVNRCTGIWMTCRPGSAHAWGYWCGFPRWPPGAPWWRF